jgi:hypothetical protein
MVYKNSYLAAGLPDGLLSNQKSQFWKNFGSLGIENVVIIYDLLEYFTTIWYNLQPFGIVCGHLVYFSVLGKFCPRKLWQPCLAAAGVICWLFTNAKVFLRRRPLHLH